MHRFLRNSKSLNRLLRTPAEFYHNRKKSVEGISNISLTPLCKVCLLLPDFAKLHKTPATALREDLYRCPTMSNEKFTKLRLQSHIKLWFSFHPLRRNSQLLNYIKWRYPVLNFTQLGWKCGKYRQELICATK